MVVLTRKVGERLLIGASVVVEVLDVCAGRVRFGVQAPKGVTVLREVLDVCAGRVRFGVQAPKGVTVLRKVFDVPARVNEDMPYHL